VYSKYFNRGDFVFGGGDHSVDAWDKLQGGFRMDWSGTSEDKFTLQGDIFKGGADSQTAVSTLSGFPLPSISTVTINDTLDLEGANILGRWKHIWSDRSDMTMQMYYDRTKRSNIVFGEIRNTIDFDFQHRFDLSSNHELIWGLGYHLTRDDFEVGPYYGFDPTNHDAHLYSGFAQDTISLLEDTLQLSLGSKFEYNDFTGFEVQPSGRLLWTVHDYHSIWGSITRAVRTPGRGEHDVLINIPVDFGGGMEGIYRLLGNDRTTSEELMAYELGYRIKQDDRLFVEFSTFFNCYDNLISVASDDVIMPGGPGEVMIAPNHAENEASGETYGIELAANYKVTENWQLSPGYSYVREQLEIGEFVSIGSFTTAEGNTARNQFNLRSLINLSENVELDTYLYYVDNLPNLDMANYIRLDARLGWHISDSMELSLVGQNLIDDQHGEFSSQDSRTIEIPRSFYVKLTWRF
ncbi:MAG: TonB-dependent receptor, partial [Planctomycetes bacterium]|nr:TonB-dependent receptor [Planctomycetota bacterium]